MKKVLLVALFAMLAASMALAVVPQFVPSTDVLGAHLVYGRGCVACHAPHSGALGNGQTSDASTGATALWGADVSKLYGQSFAFGEGSYTFTAPASLAVGSAHDANTGIMLCLSCHDGNLAKNGMMKGTTVETIPNAIGGNAPTLLGADGSAKSYGNDHPVGPLAVVTCGGTWNWDCTSTNGVLSMNGPASTAFVANYGKTVQGSLANGGAAGAYVTCTSCHDQHSMTAYNGTIAGVKGTYQTMFFVRGYYNPANPASNSAAQFCRGCHGGESNEMHNSTTVPTI